MSQWKKKLEQSVTKLYYGSEIERQVFEATSAKPWGASGTELQSIADATHDYTQYGVVMRTIWARFSDNQLTWRQIYKTLILLESLIRQGNERCVDDARHHLYEIRQLTEYQCMEEGVDQGLNVREKARSLADLLNDEDRIREERDKAKRNRTKFRSAVSSEGTGFGGSYGGYGGGGIGGGGMGGGGNDDDRRHGYDDPPARSNSRYDDPPRSNSGRYDDPPRSTSSRYDDPPRRKDDERRRSRSPPRRRSRSRSPPRRERSRSPPALPPRPSTSGGGKIKINIASSGGQTTSSSRQQQQAGGSPNLGPIPTRAAQAQQSLIPDLFDVAPKKAAEDDFFNPRGTSAPAAAPAAAGNGGWSAFGDSNNGFGAASGFTNFTSAPAPAAAAPVSFQPMTPTPAVSASQNTFDFGDFAHSLPAPSSTPLVPSNTAQSTLAGQQQQKQQQQQQQPKKPSIWDGATSLVSLDHLAVQDKPASPPGKPQAVSTPGRKPSLGQPAIGLGGMGVNMGGNMGMGMGMGGNPNMGMGGMGMGMGMAGNPNMGMGMGMGMGGNPNMGMGGMNMGMGGNNMGMGGNNMGMGGMNMGMGANMGMGGNNMGMGMGMNPGMSGMGMNNGMGGMGMNNGMGGMGGANMGMGMGGMPNAGRGFR